MNAIVIGNIQLSSVQFFGRPEHWPENAVYIGMPGKAARAFGIEDSAVPGFGKPWYCLKDERGWEIAYREYLHRRLLDDDAFRADVLRLNGKILLCWCLAKATRQPGFHLADFKCHGLILAKAVHWLNRAVDMEIA